MTIQTFEPNQDIIKEGDEANAMYIVQEGQVRHVAVGIGKSLLIKELLVAAGTTWITSLQGVVL